MKATIEIPFYKIRLCGILKSNCDIFVCFLIDLGEKIDKIIYELIDKVFFYQDSNLQPGNFEQLWERDLFGCEGSLPV